MKLGIDGKVYDLKGALMRPSLNDLHALLLATGIGVKTLKLRMQRIDELPDFEDIFEDAELMDALRSLVWLARRNAGERLSVEDANDFGMDTFELVSDEDDVPAADLADPTTAPTDSDPAAGAVVAETPSSETSMMSEALS